MAQVFYSGDCPHCGTKQAAFTAIGQHVLGAQDMQAIDWSVFMTCNVCSRGIVLEVRQNMGQKSSGPMSGAHSVTLGSQMPAQPYHYEIRHVYPKASVSRAPDDVPIKIAATYIEACDNKRARHFETSAILARKVIDLATKNVRGEAAKSENLYQRIDALRAEGVITGAMADWAHAVRLEANGPTHSDEDVTEAEASNLLHFTETFLLYSFTLPAMVSRRETPVPQT